MKLDAEAQIPLKAFPESEAAPQNTLLQGPSLKQRLATWIHQHEDILVKVGLTSVVSLMLLYITTATIIYFGFIDTDTQFVYIFQVFVNFTMTLSAFVMVLGAVMLTLFGVVCIFFSIWSEHGILDYDSPMKPYWDAAGYTLGGTLVFSILTALQAMAYAMVGAPGTH